MSIQRNYYYCPYIQLFSFIYFSPLSMYLKDKVFGKIGLLQNLRKLTFAGMYFMSCKYSKHISFE